MGLTQALSYLGPERLTTIASALVDARDNKGLYFLPKTPTLPSDGDYFGYSYDRVLAADVVALDGVARVHKYGKAKVNKATGPKWKHGVAFTEEEMKQIIDFDKNASGSSSWSSRAFEDTLYSKIKLLIDGIDISLENVIIQAKLDTGSYSYSANGIIQSNISWGTHSALKRDISGTSNLRWLAANDATAKPVNDVLQYFEDISIQLNKTFSRMIMSRSLFRGILNNANFLAAAKTVFAPAIFSVPANQWNTFKQVEIAKAVFGVEEIVFYDKFIYTDANSGAIASGTRMLPANYIIFDDPANDNNPSTFRLANGPVMESVVAPIAGNVIGKFKEGLVGPVAYATGPPELNPPNVTAWAAQAAWPQKRDIFSNGVMKVAAASADVTTDPSFIDPLV